MVIKYIALLSVGFLIYLSGFCQGLNRGWDLALAKDPQCKPVISTSADCNQ